MLFVTGHFKQKGGNVGVQHPIISGLARFGCKHCFSVTVTLTDYTSGCVTDFDTVSLTKLICIFCLCG